jgi:hypothetical protein
MKKGKVVKLKGYHSYKVSYGTVDSKNLKSIFINLQTWAEPKKTSQNWIRSVGLLKREIRQAILDVINNEVFEEDFIVDLDIRTSGINLAKRSFTNLECVLYTKKEILFNDWKIKKSVDEIVQHISKSVLKSSEIFDFYYSKSSQENKVVTD